jgi:oxygen-dependent protoporphyrinogen oxidase
MPRVVIVGAGISGLALAYRLQQRIPSATITVLEQNTRPGGTIWTERQGGFQVEIGPNGFLDNKPATLALCRDLDLGARLQPASEGSARNRYLFLKGKLRELPASFGGFLRTDLLSWRGKLQLLLERFRKPRHDRVDESVDAFARRRAGPEAADVFADALVTGIHAGDPRLLSLRSTFPRLAEMEAKHGSVMKGLAITARVRRAEAATRGQPARRANQMWSFREGLRLLVETLHANLARPPILGVTIQGLHREPAEDGRTTWTVRGEGTERWAADAVVLACPAFQQAAILADLDAELAEQIRGIAYNRIAVVALGYHRSEVPGSLDGFGYIVPQRERRDILGAQWCSSIFPERAPAGMVLLRVLAGGWHRADVAGWEDDRLLHAVRAELQLAMGIEAVPRFHHIARWERAIPQYLLGHAERVAWIENRVGRYPGLFLGGNAYHGVALNDCTERADALAACVDVFLREQGR